MQTFAVSSVQQSNQEVKQKWFDMILEKNKDKINFRDVFIKNHSDRNRHASTAINSKLLRLWQSGAVEYRNTFEETVDWN